MSVRERIRLLALERGLSLPALETKLGFGNGTIVKWDRSSPNAAKLNQTAKFLGVTMDYLMNGDEAEEENGKKARDTETAAIAEDTARLPMFAAGNRTECPAQDSQSAGNDIAPEWKALMHKLTQNTALPFFYNGEALDPESVGLFRDNLKLAFRCLYALTSAQKTQPLSRMDAFDFEEPETESCAL